MSVDSWDSFGEGIMSDDCEEIVKTRQCQILKNIVILLLFQGYFCP